MKKILLLILLSFSLSGCAISYDKFYTLDDKYLERRQMTTRYFDTKNENHVLVSSVQVLQDLGYIISENNVKLGIITAKKNREAGSTGEKVAAAVVSAIFGGPAIYDVSQEIYTTLVTTKSNNKAGYNVRIEFSTIIYNNVGGYRVERISDANIYKEFFEKLSQSMFLTANDI